jgi:ribose/xylose/arabinose/galactoside ABC-type transport system permease subunit
MNKAITTKPRGSTVPPREDDVKVPWTDLLRRGFPLIFLVILIVVFTSMSPRFLSLENLSSVLDEGTVLLVTANG